MTFALDPDDPFSAEVVEAPPGAAAPHFRVGLATWGAERLDAAHRTLKLLPAAVGPLPVVGFHWLHGLLLLRSGHRGPALKALAHEMDDGRDRRGAAAEFRTRALVAAGFAHLEAEDATGAIDAFRWVLESDPHHGRALVGLSRALAGTSPAAAARARAARIANRVADLNREGRHAEAAVVAAPACAATGDLAQGCAELDRLLETAPHGQTGWTIPIDPALTPLRSHPSFARLLARLAARAA